MNEATWGKSSSKEEKKFSQLWLGIKQLKKNNAHSEWKTGQAN